MIGADFLRFNDEQLYLAADLETCSLNLMESNYPWQIAWTVGTNKKIIEHHNHYINWGFPLKVSKGAAMVTGFDQTVIDRMGESPVVVYKLFNQYLLNPKYRLISHNWLGFDSMVRAFWAAEIDHEHDYDYLDRLIDTNCIAKAIKKGIKPDRANFRQWQFKMTSVIEKGLKTSLGVSLDEYKIPVDKSLLHRADYDTPKNLELWWKQMWEIEI